MAASYNYSSNSSSELSTPRSSSPSSVLSRSSTATTISKRMSISQRRISGFDPMSAVNIDTVEAAMKAASLDSFKGYNQNNYGTIKQYRTTDYVPKSSAGGYQVLREPAWNKGTLTTNQINGARLTLFMQVHHSVPMIELPKTSLASYPMS